MSQIAVEYEIDHLFSDLVPCDMDENPAEWYMLFDCGHYSLDCTGCKNMFLNEIDEWYCTHEECFKDNQNPIKYIRIEKL